MAGKILRGKRGKKLPSSHGSACPGLAFLIPSPPEENSVHVSPVAFLFTDDFRRVCGGRMRFQIARKLRGIADAVTDWERPPSAPPSAHRAEEKTGHYEEKRKEG